MTENQNDWKNRAHYSKSELDHIERTFGSFDEYVRVGVEDMVREAEEVEERKLLATVRAEADAIGVFDVACREAEDLVRPIYKMWGC